MTEANSGVVHSIKEGLLGRLETNMGGIRDGWADLSTIWRRSFMYHIISSSYVVCIWTHSPQWEKIIFSVTCVHIQTHNLMLSGILHMTHHLQLRPWQATSLFLLRISNCLLNSIKHVTHFYCALSVLSGHCVLSLHLPSRLVRPWAVCHTLCANTHS